MSRPQRLLALLILLALAAGTSWIIRSRRAAATAASPRPAPAQREDLARRFLEREAAAQAAMARDFGPELEAQRHEDALNSFWDELNRNPDRAVALLRPILRGPGVFPTAPPSRPQPPGIVDHAGRWAGQRWDDAELLARLDQLTRAGWSLRRSEWHLVGFQPASNGPPSGVIEFRLLGEHASGRRGAIEGTAAVRLDPVDPARLEGLQWRSLQVRENTSQTPLRRVVDVNLPVPPHTPFTDPLLVTDLEADGRPELALVGAGVIGRLTGTGWAWQPLEGLPAERLWAAAAADLDGDGWDDLLLASGEGLRVVRRDGPRPWRGPGTLLWRPPLPLRHPQAITLGDFDGDGDLDVWLVQYKLPYQGGQFPTPFHDASDGFPSYLLRNDGRAGFVDVTREAGLEPKRFRRSYSASFIDLDLDGDLDLVNVSDFAGLDVYLNDGRGRYRDRTDTLGLSRHAFGMAHAVVDLNGDPWPDLVVIGMGSTVARRLDGLKLESRDGPGDMPWRGEMTRGNRVFLGGVDGLQPAPFAAELADGGWAWGVAPFDLENDGRTDFHLANGHETRASVTDYERQFWLNDLHAAGSNHDPVADAFFRAQAGRRVQRQASYGGWQNSALFWNAGGGRFTEAAWLLGSAVPADSRNAVADDFDGDGRLDLAVTTFEEFPATRQRLQIFRNETAVTGHWLGLTFPEGPGRPSPWNVRVTVETASGTRRRWMVTGDSFRSQGRRAVHFGLGQETGLRQVTVRWPDGKETQLGANGLDRWYPVVDPPGGRASAPESPVP